jgi:uncharacterized coiled-coil DUF342 family protein
MEVYLVRESKISRLFELEADVEKLSRTNSRLIAQIQRLETDRNEIAQKISQIFKGANKPFRPRARLQFIGFRRLGE